MEWYSSSTLLGKDIFKMDKEKHVDESWKESVAQEKKDAVIEPSDSSVMKDSTNKPDEMELTFLNYVTSLSYQAMIFLGEVPNPMNNNQIDVELKQAKFLIDTLILLRDKTKGNLDEKEENLLKSAIYETQMRYVDKSKQQSN